MKHLLLVLSVLVFALAVNLQAGEPRDLVSVSLELPHATILPGVPFDMVVLVKNLSNRPVAVGLSGTVIITPEGGEAIRIPDHVIVRPGGALPSFDNLELEPGESRAGLISWGTNWLHNDAAFTVPGHYDISLELTGDPDEAEPVTVYVGTVRTPTVRLTRVIPVGDDAAVWERIRTGTAEGDRWTSWGFYSTRAGQALAQEVIDKYPGSGYVPYAMLLRHSTPYFDLSVADAAIGRFRDSPAYARLVVTAGGLAISAANKAEKSGASREELERLYGLAKSYSEEALRTGELEVKEQARVNRDDAQHRTERLRQPRSQSQ